MTFRLPCFFRNVPWLPFIIIIPKFHTMHCIQLIMKVVLEESVKRVDASPNFSEKKRWFQLKTTTTALCLTISWVRNLGRTQLIWYGMVPSLHGRQMGKKWKQWQILFSWAKKSLWTVIVTMKLKDTCSLEGKVKVKVAQSSPTLCDPMDYIVRGILQARILEWVAIPFSRGSSQPRDRSQVSCIADGFFTSWATREGKLWQT